ncbi:uncharacterized protein LOC105203472 [Solenopsis invicta]|uniref:uncharacterized protein LOC105203472 n=1 Tax=Solenopsis invicta TaxID=13686 RepID=UPI00193D4625|nr:uncharacterized protein LOC105203472 [Solenopsis invicta]
MCISGNKKIKRFHDRFHRHRRAWEHHLGSSKEPPTWNQLNEFLISRLLSLQAFEKSRSGKSSTVLHPVTTKSHFQEKAKNSHSNKSSLCTLCSAEHYIANCPKYISKTVPQRLSLIKQQQLCYNCLGSHKASACRITKRCIKCGQKHHTTIHQNNNSTINTAKITPSDTVKSATETKSSETKSTEAHVLHASIENESLDSIALLATAQVLVTTASGETVKARALIDPGSEISLISERLTKLLHIPRSHSSISLIGAGGKRIGRTKGSIKFAIKAHFDPQSEIPVSAYILPKVTTKLPSVPIPQSNWPHLEGLTLADYHYATPGPVDLILGIKVYARIIQDGVVTGDETSPIAQRSKLGWIISGSVNSDEETTVAHGYHISVDTELHDLLQCFWKLEEISTSTSSPLSIDEQKCEEHFKQTHSRDPLGRYIVRLPFKRSPIELGDSKTRALRIIINLSRKLSNDSKLAKAYSEFLDEYEKLDHMRLVTSHHSEPCYYLPHHGVIRETSLTTKLRVVFNGSSRTSTGISLNDLLYIGAKLQTDVF